uniref:Uncharacterized protein n=1 Tax=Magallana gigas TaxID=29159 RepID=K1PDA5_MAGGI
MEKKNNQTQIERKNRGRTPGQVQRDLLTFHVQQCIQKNKERMDEVLQELMMLHYQQKIKTSKKLMTRVFAELMTFHAQQRTTQIKEKMREVCAELMTIHAQRETQTQKIMKRMQLVFAELLQTNSERKKLKLLDEEAYEEFVPRKLFLFNIISFKQTDDDHLLQVKSYKLHDVK